jgi:hypothetical protein
MVEAGPDTSLTAGRHAAASRHRSVSALLHGVFMTDEGVDRVIRQAIGGDRTAVAWILEHADTSEDPLIIAMAALLESSSVRLDRAWTVASSRHDRQAVAIARARLEGDDDLVDALARDHLLDHPDSYVVAWIASVK